MHTFPLLPELMDLVFQHVEEDRSLRSCRLVSRAFCAAATRSFFRTFNITLRDPIPTSNTIARCKAMNELLYQKSYILDYTRVIRIFFTSEWEARDPLAEEFRGVSLAGIDSSELTKLLLKLTQAVGLEELFIDAGGWDSWHYTQNVGKDNMLALLAIRCMPSLRRMHLEYLDNPPIALLIGIPGKDTLLEMSIESGSLDIEPMEAHWNALCVPVEGPLAHPFKEAKADWDTILLITSHIHRFSSAETPPLHQLGVLNVKELESFHTLMFYIQEKMGGRQPLFPQLRTFHCRPSISNDLSAGQTPEWVGRMLFMDYGSVRKIVITMQPSLTGKSSFFLASTSLNVDDVPRIRGRLQCFHRPTLTLPPTSRNQVFACQGHPRTKGQDNLDRRGDSMAAHPVSAAEHRSCRHRVDVDFSINTEVVPVDGLGQIAGLYGYRPCTISR